MKNTAKFGTSDKEKKLKIKTSLASELTSSRAYRGRTNSHVQQVTTECDTPLHKVPYNPQNRLNTSDPQDHS
jgi:hypothetical protein